MYYARIKGKRGTKKVKVNQKVAKTYLISGSKTMPFTGAKVFGMTGVKRNSFNSGYVERMMKEVM